VKDAIDNGISANDTTRLAIDRDLPDRERVAWLPRRTSSGLALLGQGIVPGLREHLFRH
jgi:hypothetical protein